jgi:anti-sigma factor RsiW
MNCQQCRQELDRYLDGELSEASLRGLETHLRSCPACAGEVLSRVQMKRAVHSAALRYTPEAAFRGRVEERIRGKAHNRRWTWQLAATVAVLILTIASAYLWHQRTQAQRVYDEIADLHVTNLASSTPVEVASSDRHTVKPWFAGRIPFTFNLPELDNTGFTLLGGRLAYLDEIPGAQLVYQVRQHRISVFIFPERFSPRLPPGNTRRTQRSFNLNTWTEGGLRYFVIGDTADVEHLSVLLKKA